MYAVSWFVTLWATWALCQQGAITGAEPLRLTHLRLWTFRTMSQTRSLSFKFLHIQLNGLNYFVIVTWSCLRHLDYDFRSVKNCSEAPGFCSLAVFQKVATASRTCQGGWCAGGLALPWWCPGKGKARSSVPAAGGTGL